MSKTRATIQNGFRWSRRAPEGLIYPHGYCTAYVTAQFQEETKRDEFSAKYHNSDHASSAECKACYREFQLDQLLDLEAQIGWISACYAENCTTDTEQGASVEGYIIPLCEEHRTIEQVTAIYTGPWETND